MPYCFARNASPSLQVWLFFLIPFVVLCDRFVDIPLALFVKDYLFSNAAWTRHTSSIPDLLLQLVLLTTGCAFSCYLVRAKKGIYDDLTRCLMLIGWAAPVSYLGKNVLKLIFARENTRLWLQQPHLYGFHWFKVQRGLDAFPSGHMMVIVALLAVWCRFYPKARTISVMATIMLGGMLITTNYHFLSDVAAGIWGGLCVEAVLFRFLPERHRRHCGDQ